jgi:hypothetical protein
VAVVPLVPNPGAELNPKTRVYVLDEQRRVVAGPLVIGRRRAYHREWLLAFEGITARAGVEGWRGHFVAVDGADAHD